MICHSNFPGGYNNTVGVKRRRAEVACDLASQVYSHFLCGVATISRLLEIVGLFCRKSSLLQGSFAKETYNFKEPTNRSHPIVDLNV